MKKSDLTLPEIGLIGGTRAILGAGLALLLSDYLDSGPRKAVGWSLFLVGAISTIPIAANVLSKLRESEGTRPMEGAG